MESHPDRRMAALGEWQWRCVATRQLRVIGITARQIRRRYEAARLHRRYQSVHVLGTPDLSVHGEWMAAVLAYPLGTRLGARSGAELRGYLRPQPIIHVITPRATRPRDRIRPHRCKRGDAGRIEVCAHIPTTTVPQTFIDLAATESERTVLRAFRAADTRGHIVMRELYAACVPRTGRRGIRYLRGLIEEAVAPEPTRSEFEDAFGDFCDEQDLPAPRMNRFFGGDEADAWWPPTPVVCELDSWTYHGDRFAFETDRTKIERLQVAGYSVLPVTYRRMTRDPKGLAQSIRALLARHGAV